MPFRAGRPRSVAGWCAVAFTAAASHACILPACAPAGPTLAEQECGLPPDPTPCESCLTAACGSVCAACVEDEACFACTVPGEGDEPPPAPPPGCEDNAAAKSLLACVATNCATECADEPKEPRPRKGRKGKAGDGTGDGTDDGGSTDRGDDDDGGGRERGGRDGKAGKGERDGKAGKGDRDGKRAKHRD